MNRKNNKGIEKKELYKYKTKMQTNTQNNYFYS